MKVRPFRFAYCVSVVALAALTSPWVLLLLSVDRRDWYDTFNRAS